MKTFLLGFAAVIALILFLPRGCENAVNIVQPKPDFTEEQITMIQADMRTHLEAQNKDWEITGVGMVKDAPRHLTGFVTMHKNAAFLVPERTQTLNCTATMDEDSGRNLWECK